MKVPPTRTPRLSGDPVLDQQKRKSRKPKRPTTRRGPLNAQTFGRVLAEAESKLNLRPNNTGNYVELRLDQVITRTELFQPRRFPQKNTQLDMKHVKALEKKISYEGELTPILVIKIDGMWVVVDGHHRLAAYGRKQWKKPIKCEWFAGNVRQAVDACDKLNAVIKLAVPNEDRYERAWQRVMLSDPETRKGWSKNQIKEACSVSDGLVSMMRRAQARYKRGDDLGKQMREKLGGRGIEQVSWTEARQAYLNLDEREISADRKAHVLARAISKKLAGRLAEDPACTAQALAIYDPELIEPLVEALQEVLRKQQAEDGADEDMALAIEYGVMPAPDPASF
jgi:hypothetical protein